MRLLSALDTKALRDLLRLKGQATATALVMACGVATFVLSLSTLESLEEALAGYYEHYRFAEVFAHLERAPRALERRLEEIAGVAQVQARIVETVTLDMPDLAEPADGRIISLEPGNEGLNELHLRAGRRVEPGRGREVLVSEAFADAHELRPGATVRAVLNGRLEELRIVGIALSPEYIYQIRETDLLPDATRFGVFWMERREMEAAFDMEGAFNDVILSLMPHASEAEVIDRIDELTARYGGLGAYGREDQLSHKFVANEIEELRSTTAVVPVVFLGVAAFLLNVVLSRLVSTQREQIAALKALGYSRLEIGLHYLKLVGIIVLAAAVVGTVAGAWMGAGMTRMYTQFFHFPVFRYTLDPSVVVWALLISGGAAVAGTVGAVRRAMRLPPAEAMRPAPPATYRPTIIERSGLQGLLSPATRMILRQLERRPIKAALSCLGIALAVSILVLGNFLEDAIDEVMDLEFSAARRYDLDVVFLQPRSREALAEVAQLPGVVRAEPYRAVAARLRNGHHSRRVGITGMEPGGSLMHLIDVHRHAVRMPPEGLVLSAKLAEILAVQPGDDVVVEVLEESRPIRRVAVARLVEDFSGVAAYMSLEAANRMLQQPQRINGAFVAADADRRDELFGRLKESPVVAGVAVKEAALISFRETIAESLLRMKMFNVIFAVIIAFGVVYNSARVSLSERSRELATLRVIGFTRAEISMIQLGELAVLTAVAVPAGLALGFALAWASSNAYDTELFRIPLVIDRATYGFAAAVVLGAAVVSGLVVRRLLDRLDLVAVLKYRE